METQVPTCPHCGAALSAWSPPAESSWGLSPQWVCFNDQCSYFLRGWEWMREHFAQNVSYRYRLDPATGESGPLPVWSSEALRERIMSGETAECEMTQHAKQ